MMMVRMLTSPKLDLNRGARCALLTEYGIFSLASIAVPVVYNRDGDNINERESDGHDA